MPTQHPAPSEEGRAWCALCSPLKDGTLGWFLDLAGSDLPVEFDEFCGATGTGKQSEEPGIWQNPFTNTSEEGGGQTAQAIRSVAPNSRHSLPS